MISKKKFVIKRSKLKNFSTSKEMFKYLFQNQISLEFLSKYNTSEDKVIDFNSAQGKIIYKAALTFLNSIIQNYGNFKIHLDHLELTPINYLGIIHINNIGNNKNLYFKHHSPEPNNLFYTIIGLINPVLLTKSNVALLDSELEKLPVSLTDEKSEIIKLITQKIILYTFDTFSRIIIALKQISKWLNKGILIFQDSINPSISTNKNIVNCTHESLDLSSSDILILHVSYRDNFLFQPIIHINLDDKSKINYIIENSEQRQYFFKLFEEEKIMKDTIRVEIPDAPYTVTKSPIKYIYFNPYDKNKLLPLIEINITPTKKQTFLLGHKFQNYHNLYVDDDKINDLVGQVKFNDNNTIDVDWCEGFDPEK